MHCSHTRPRVESMRVYAGLYSQVQRSPPSRPVASDRVLSISSSRSPDLYRFRCPHFQRFQSLRGERPNSEMRLDGRGRGSALAGPASTIAAGLQRRCLRVVHDGMRAIGLALLSIAPKLRPASVIMRVVGRRARSAVGPSRAEVQRCCSPRPANSPAAIRARFGCSLQTGRVRLFRFASGNGSLTVKTRQFTNNRKYNL